MGTYRFLRASQLFDLSRLNFDCGVEVSDLHLRPVELCVDIVAIARFSADDVLQLFLLRLACLDRQFVFCDGLFKPCLLLFCLRVGLRD